MRRKRERRGRDAIWRSRIEGEQPSEWSNQPGGARRWIASKKDYWRLSSLPYKDFGSTVQKIWLQVVAVPPKMATPETFHLFAPRVTSHFIPPWRARLFTSENSPINFFCNFIFSHLGEDSYGERWSEKRMKSLGTPPPPYLNSIAFVSEPHSGWPWGASLHGSSLSDQN